MAQINMKQVAVDAATFAAEIRTEMLGKLVGRQLTPGETVFPLKDMPAERVLAMQRGLAAVIVQWRQLVLNAGFSVEAVLANEAEGVRMGEAINTEDALVQAPRGDKSA